MKLINWWALDIHWAFNAIEAYAGRMEQQIEKMAEEDEARIHADPPDEEESGNVWSQHHWLFEETLPRSLRYSCIVLLMTTLEATLLQICRELQERRKLRLAPGDLAGGPHEKALTYIRKVAGVDLPDHPFRATLADLIIVRNCVAHAAGNVDLMAAPAKVRAAAGRLGGFTVSSEGYLEIERGVCSRLIGEGGKWVSQILEAANLAFRVEHTERDKA